jgi:hypothetical protein
LIRAIENLKTLAEAKMMTMGRRLRHPEKEGNGPSGDGLRPQRAGT